MASSEGNEDSEGSDGNEVRLPSHHIAAPRIDPSVTPFRETIAFRKYGRNLDPAPDWPEDLYVKALIEQQGFDGLPHVVPSELLDRFISRGEPEFFRGVRTAQHANHLRYGAMFIGRGGRGGGVYAAGGLDGVAHARNYAMDQDAVILRMTLKEGSLVLTREEAARLLVVGR